MKFPQKVTDRQILTVLYSLGPVRMSTVAAQLGVTRQAISYRLLRLERLKRVQRRRGFPPRRKPDLWSLCKPTKASDKAEA